MHTWVTGAGAGVTLFLASLASSVAVGEPNATLEGNVVGTYQAASRSHVGGDSVHDEFNGQLYLFGTLDMGPGSWNMEVRGGTTPRSHGVSSFYGSNGLVGETLTSHGHGRMAVTQLFYELQLGPGQFRAGLLDPTALLDANEVANDEYTQFLADSFVNNPAIGFPSFVLGAAYQGEASKNLSYKFFVGSDSGLEDEDHSYGNVFSLGGHREGYRKGAFTTAELDWHSDGYMLKGGLWYDSGHVARLNSDGHSNGYGFYALAGMALGKGRLSGRFGIANQDAQEAANFFSLAYQRPIPLAGHETTLGLAAGRTGASSRLTNRDSIYQAEAYWRINLVKSFYVSPDIQYVSHAGFDADSGDAVIVGTRLGVAF